MKRRHTSAASLLLAQTKRFAAMDLSAKTAHKMLAYEGFKDLKAQTSGTTKTKELRAMGHPFGRGVNSQAGGARKGQRRKMRTAPINRQSGKLNQQIYLKKQSRNSLILGSNAPYAKYLFSHNGTKKMVRRGVMGGRKRGGKIGLIEKYWRARMKGVRESWKKAGRS